MISIFFLHNYKKNSIIQLKHLLVVQQTLNEF